MSVDLATAEPTDIGHALRGIGLNLLCRDVRATAGFLCDVLGLQVVRQSADFAIIRHDGMLMQFHSDATFGAHPLLALLPDMPPRGAGAQIYLFGLDPDAVVARADPDAVLERPRDKPHGLREATVLSPDGYALTVARRI